MRAFTQTKAFGELLAPMDAEMVRLQDDLDRLARTVEDKKNANLQLSKSKQRPTKADENSIARLQKDLNELREKKLRYLSGDVKCLQGLPMRALITLLAQCHDDPKLTGTFTSEEQEQEQVTVSYEGKREREIRIRLGLDPQPTVEHNDTPYGEIKYGGSNVEPFRTYQAGRKCWGAAFRQIIRTWQEESLAPEVWDALFDGEVSAGKIYNEFPEDLRHKIQGMMSPDKALSVYDKGIFYATDEAYLHVPVWNYVEAFNLVCITQMGPKYRIRREYVESQLVRTLQGG